MRHRKTNHYECIQLCRDNYDGECCYGDQLCWFKHENGSESPQSLKCEPSMLGKLFSMMEQFAERMNNLENQL